MSLPEIEELILTARRPEVVNRFRTLRDNLVDAHMLVEAPAFWVFTAMLMNVTTKALGDVAKGALEPWREGVQMLDAKLREDPSRPSALYQVGQRLVEGMGTQPIVDRSLQILRQWALVRTWAALEAFSSDLWEDTLNEQNLFRTVVSLDALLETNTGREIEGLTNKMISVKSLIRHDLNLQGKMGTLLRDKFDFTSVAGINKAYAAAFKATPSPQLSATHKLWRIEATRHIIVHRAGEPDEKFRSQFDVTVARLELTKAEITESIRLIGTECAGLAKRLDDIVAS
jgi:hypothetical protein